MWLKLCFIALLFAVAYGRSPLQGESRPNFRVDLSDSKRHSDEVIDTDSKRHSDEVIDTGFEDPVPWRGRYRCPRGWAFKCIKTKSGRRICKCWRRHYPGRGRDEPVNNY